MAKAKIKGPSEWEDSEDYPTKRDICGFCGQKDLVKLSFDQVRYICLNASACVLRWKKSLQETMKPDP